MEHFLQGYHQLIITFLMMTGIYITIAYDNLVKKLIGLNVLQASVFVFFIMIGAVESGTAPILAAGAGPYSNPLPHVLILTAIVVNVATTSLGLALVIKIRRAYGTLDEKRIGDFEKDPG